MFWIFAFKISIVSNASTSKVWSCQSMFWRRFAFLLSTGGPGEESILFGCCSGTVFFHLPTSRSIGHYRKCESKDSRQSMNFIRLTTYYISRKAVKLVSTVASLLACSLSLFISILKSFSSWFHEQHWHDTLNSEKFASPVASLFACSSSSFFSILKSFLSTFHEQHLHDILKSDILVSTVTSLLAFSSSSFFFYLKIFLSRFHEKHGHDTLK